MSRQEQRRLPQLPSDWTRLDENEEGSKVAISGQTQKREDGENVSYPLGNLGGIRLRDLRLFVEQGSEIDTFFLFDA